MPPVIDESHDARVRSWVIGVDGHRDFPLTNLPLGVFSNGVFAHGDDRPRGGVVVGGHILDLGVALSEGLLDAGFALAAQAPLNDFLSLGAGPRRALRRALFALLRVDSPQRQRAEALGERLLVPVAQSTLHLPVAIGDYTDFYAGIHHAENIGRMLRPDHPLLPNYKHVPIGYHGRASSVRVSGEPVCRPSGQIKGPDDTAPRFERSAKLDYETELGIIIGPGNRLAEPITIGDAADHIAGYCLLNDWSARDIQAWEYQPLGPFLAKSFHTTISPWLVTPEALAPFTTAQRARPSGDPHPLPYLYHQADQQAGALSIMIETSISTAGMRAAGLPAHRLSLSPTNALYWTPAQLLTHHASGGCNLRPGDLLGSGTISGETQDSFGSLMELSANGRKPLTLPNGEVRSFLDSGDEIIMRGFAERDGFAPIGFGEARGRIDAAR